MEKNIAEWQEAGGIGILFKDAEKTIEAVDKYNK